VQEHGQDFIYETIDPKAGEINQVPDVILQQSSKSCILHKNQKIRNR
jgi:hypothetical protein